MSHRLRLLPMLIFLAVPLSAAAKPKARTQVQLAVKPTGAQVFIDGKPQPNWNRVLAMVGLESRGFQQSTLNPSVLTPGEHLKVISFGANETEGDSEKKAADELRQKARWEQFRKEAEKRMAMNICFCSTLDECWMYSDAHPIGYKEYTQLVKPVDRCPQIPTAEMFIN